MPKAILSFYSVCYPGAESRTRIEHHSHNVAAFQDGEGTAAAYPSVETRAILWGALALHLVGVSATWDTQARTAKLVGFFFFVISCFVQTILFPELEGLGIKFAYTSSLATVADYQNASLYLNLVDNTAFTKFKVIQYKHAVDHRCEFLDSRCPSCRTIQALMISRLKFLDGTNDCSLWLRY